MHSASGICVHASCFTPPPGSSRSRRFRLAHTWNIRCCSRVWWHADGRMRVRPRPRCPSPPRSSSQWGWCCYWFRRLRRCAERVPALLAGVVLLASPAFMTQAPAEYADVPLAFFFLAALALIVQGAHVALPVARRRLCRLCRLDQERRRAAGGRTGRGAFRERVALQRMAVRCTPGWHLSVRRTARVVARNLVQAGTGSARPVGRTDDGRTGAKAFQRRPMA